jgi:hypothetical protein
MNVNSGCPDTVIAEQMKKDRKTRRTPMTRRNRIFANAALALTLTAGFAATRSAAAQTRVTQVKARIPFAFSADKKPMPAGTYSVEIRGNQFLAFNNTETGETTVVIIRTDSFAANKGGTRLTFHREAGQTYLTQLWIGGSNVHSELISHPKPQRELAKLPPPDAIIELAAE